MSARALQPVDRGAASEKGERLEQRWSDGTAGDRHADGRLGLAKLEPVGLAEGQRRSVERFGGPLDVGEGRDGTVEQCRCRLVAGEGLGDRCLVHLGLIEKEEVDHRRNLGQGLHPALHFAGQRQKHVSVEVVCVPRPLGQVGLRRVEKLLRAQGAYLLGVDVGQLLGVEGGRCGVDALQRELLDDLADRTDLDAVVGPPAEQGQVVDHRLREVPGLPVVLHRHVVAPLRQLLTSLADDQRQVGEDRLILDAHRPAQQHRLGGGVEQVFAANDVGDPHGGVVDGVGDEEGHRPVAAGDDEVLQVRAFEADVAADHVVEGDRAGIGGGKAHHGVLADRQVALTAEPVVARRSVGLGIAGIDVAAQAIAGVGLVLLEQPADRLAIDVGALGLAQLLASVVPVEAQPFQRVEHHRHQLGSRLLGVGVLDADQKLAADRSGEQPVEQSGPGRAEVQRAGGGRGKANGWSPGRG